MNSDHAPTAERIRVLAQMFGVCDGGRYLNDWIAKSEQIAAKSAHAANLESELAIARDLIGKMEVRIADDELAFNHANDVAGKLQADLDAARDLIATMRARIEELTGCKFSDRMWAALKARAEAAEAQLQSVREMVAYYTEDDDSQLARIRAILEGK